MPERLVKGERGTEWANLMQTLEDAGLRPADVARELGMSHGRLSQIKAGEEPSAVWLIALRMLVDKVAPPPKSKADELRETPPDYMAADLRDAFKRLRAALEDAERIVGVNSPPLIEQDILRSAGAVLKAPVPSGMTHTTPAILPHSAAPTPTAPAEGAPFSPSRHRRKPKRAVPGLNP